MRELRGTMDTHSMGMYIILYRTKSFWHGKGIAFSAFVNYLRKKFPRQFHQLSLTLTPSIMPADTKEAI